jgi:uncharacterized coiled-coil DUF342 family protein
MNTLKEIRAENINKGRLISNETNKIKGCISYIEKKKKKQNEYKVKLEKIISENKSIYEDIYKRYEKATEEIEEKGEGDSIKEQEIYFKYLSMKEIDILTYFEMKEPDEII